MSMWPETESITHKWETEIDNEASILIESGTAPSEAVATAAKIVFGRRRAETIRQKDHPATRRHHLHYLP